MICWTCEGRGAMGEGLMRLARIWTSAIAHCRAFLA